MNTLADLKVSREIVSDTRLHTIRNSLPLQKPYGNSETEAAALQFGLPMTGVEIHDRVRSTLRPRWHLPTNARWGIGVWLVLSAVFLGFFAPWGWDSWGKCVAKEGTKASCDGAFGWGLSMVIGLAALLIAGFILAGNIRARTRSSAWTILSSYAAYIPDTALLKYEDARSSGLFTSFLVVEPAYQEIQVRRIVDPWLIGYLGDSHPNPQDTQRQYIVLAYWE